MTDYKPGDKVKIWNYEDKRPTSHTSVIRKINSDIVTFDDGWMFTKAFKKSMELVELWNTPLAQAMREEDQ